MGATTQPWFISGLVVFKVYRFLSSDFSSTNVKAHRFVETKGVPLPAPDGWIEGFFTFFGEFQELKCFRIPNHATSKAEGWESLKSL